MTADDRSSRRFDFILFGATGFAGGLTAEYLATQPECAGLNWALAGRNVARLEAVRARLAALNPVLAELRLIEIDLADADRLRAVVAEARAVATTVGPYIHYGEPLVAAAAAAGTDYLDLTGEPEFVDRMLANYDQPARESGARIVNCCGFDSIPHDLGAQFTVEQLPTDQPLTVEGFVRAGGRPSGGTWHSAIHAFSRARGYAAQRRRQHRGSPESNGARRVRGTPPGVRWESRLQAWVCPFPSIDPQIVKRSARVLTAYGPDFRYGHYVAVRRLPMLAAGVAGVGALFIGAQVPPVRKALLAMRAPGEGPDEAERARGWFEVHFLGRAADGQSVHTRVSGGDPGYDETARMLGESLLCLAHDEAAARPGIGTPATVLGLPLRQRLQRAGMGFDVVSTWRDLT